MEFHNNFLKAISLNSHLGFTFEGPCLSLGISHFTTIITLNILMDLVGLNY